MTVCSDLNAVANASSAIVHELGCPTQITPADQVANAEFCIRVQCRPSPSIAPAFRFLFWRSILGLRANEIPDFIALQTAHREIANIAVMVGHARISQIDQQFNDCVLGSSRHPHRSANGAPFDEAPYDLSAASFI